MVASYVLTGHGGMPSFQAGHNCRQPCCACVPALSLAVVGSAQAQQISLNFHCKCEQFVHFATGSFFNFNGTAGALPSVSQQQQAVPLLPCASRPLLMLETPCCTLREPGYQKTLM